MKHGRALQSRLIKLEAAVEVLNSQDDYPESVFQALSKLSVEDLRVLRHFVRMQAAGSALTDWLLTQDGVRTVAASIPVGNDKSEGVLRHLGFTKTDSDEPILVHQIQGVGGPYRQRHYGPRPFKS